MKKWMIVPTFCLALTAQAGDPPAPQAVPGEIIIEQYTHVMMGTHGSITERYMRVKMKAKGSERMISTQPGSQWRITDGEKSVKEEPRVSSRVTRERGVSYEPCMPRRRLESAVIGKSVEDGVTIGGEWATFECGPIAGRAPWVERVETWYRGDIVGSNKMLRPHRREVKSPYEHMRIDYTYLETSRLHLSLFDANLP